MIGEGNMTSLMDLRREKNETEKEKDEEYSPSSIHSEHSHPIISLLPSMSIDLPSINISSTVSFSSSSHLFR